MSQETSEKAPSAQKPRSEKQIEASRENGKKGKGPITEEGKAVSKYNALRHGACARSTLLPSEDPALYEERRRLWHADFQPRGIIESEMLDDCIATSWRMYRARNNDAAFLSKKVLEAREAFDLERDDQLKALIKALPGDPHHVAIELRNCIRGCEWIIASLETMIETLDIRGWWYPTERDTVLNVFGLSTLDLFKNALAFDIVRPSLEVGWPTGGDVCRVQALIRTSAPEGMATWEYRDRMRGLARIVQMGDPEKAKAELKAIIFPEITKLKALLADLHAREAQLRDGAEDRATIDVSPEGQLRMRYEGVHRRDFRNAFRELLNFRKVMEQSGMRNESSPPSSDTHQEELSRNEPKRYSLKKSLATAISKLDGYRGEPDGVVPKLSGPAIYASKVLDLESNLSHDLINAPKPTPEDIRQFVDEVHEAMHDFDYEREQPMPM